MERLKKEIEKVGVENVARSLGINIKTLENKLKNPYLFKLKELVVLQEEYGLKESDILHFACVNRREGA